MVKNITSSFGIWYLYDQ